MSRFSLAEHTPTSPAATVAAAAGPATSAAQPARIAAEAALTTLTAAAPATVIFQHSFQSSNNDRGLINLYFFVRGMQLDGGGIFLAAAAEAVFMMATAAAAATVTRVITAVWSPSWAAAAVAWTGCTAVAAEAAPTRLLLYFSRRNGMDVGCSDGIFPAAAAEAADTCARKYFGGLYYC
ncbi:hypothetical protein PHYPSEUDO_002046 [Phytophthora pseudosyringae]|uniref:Uncharacterized protein n=1 Tax=Phytophthora pseudosyringae TaxID=221518 RepID=A0A8T1VZB4_9STRA|nr:hypothetical protein PHYPSEUDO_002046 [Phytophthora pseudosyringae]